MNRDIRLQVEGALLEKLLDRALDAGAVFARVKRISPRCMIVEGDARSTEALISLCRKYGYGCTTLRRGGKTAAFERMRSRRTLLPGLLPGILICIFLLSRVWTVDVVFTGENADAGSHEKILAALRDNGVHLGINHSDIDTDLLQKQLLAALPDISHAGIRLQGIRLLAEISPEAPAPETYEIRRARDLVALRSGVIDAIDVYSGRACVKPGDTVLRGDTLIRGEEQTGRNTETGEDITTAVRALGKVTARCWFEGSAEGVLLCTEERRTGKSCFSSRIALMNLSFPITECEGYPSEETETESLPIVGLFLPLRIERTIHRETAQTAVETDRAALQARLTSLARADALKKISAEAGEYEIRSFWTEIDENENILHIQTVYEISTDIAAARDALIEEVY